MTFETYQALFEEILSDGYATPPYNNPDFIEYTKLNASRQTRWLKKGVILPELVEKVTSIKNQKWILITEPWCGDASHLTPFIHLIAACNPAIDFEIQLRDSEPHLIDQYLTNGGKSIPILIVRDEDGNDLFTWGPRPAECLELMLTNKKADLPMEEQKKALQQWYNKDKGESIQRELLELLK